MNENISHIYLQCLLVALLFASQTAYAQVITLEITKQDVSCSEMKDGRAIVTAEGGSMPYSYAWSNGSTERIINDLAPGTYIVTVTDAQGNTAIDATGLLEFEEMEVSLSKVDGKCGDLGEITATISGGLGPFQYKWSNGEISSTISDLVQDTYEVTVSDRGFCPKVDSEDVLVNGEGLDLEADFTSPSCTGLSDGYISISQTGGELPIDYKWNNGSTTPDIENLTAGTYTIFAEDAFDCTDGIVIILSDPDSLTVDVINQNDVLYAKVEGGTPSYDFSWSNGVTGTSVLANVEPGDYGLTVEDAFGCSATGAGEILGPLNIVNEAVISFEISPTLVSNELNLALNLSTQEEITIELFSSHGESVWREYYHDQVIDAAISIQNTLPSGIYVFRINAGSGWIVSKKFIKI